LTRSLSAGPMADAGLWPLFPPLDMGPTHPAQRYVRNQSRECCGTLTIVTKKSSVDSDIHCYLRLNTCGYTILNRKSKLDKSNG